MKLSTLSITFVLATTTCFAQQPTLDWAFTAGGISGDVGYSIALDDRHGMVYVAGVIQATGNFNPNGSDSLTSVDSHDIFVAKYDTNGNYVWAISLGGPDNSEARSIAVDDSGNVYVVGYFQVFADFDPGPDTLMLNSAGNSDDIFIAKYSSSGALLWAHRMGGGHNDQAFGCAVNGNGDLFVTGYFRETVDFDPDPVDSASLTAVGRTDIFFAKYDANGSYQWAKGIGSGQDDSGIAIESDMTGNIYVTGYFENTPDFNPDSAANNTLGSNGIDDIFLSKYDGNGNYMWAISLGGAGSDAGASLATDNAGNILMTGYFSGTADFDAGSGNHIATSSGDRDIFLVKYSSNSNYLWAITMGSSIHDQGYFVTTDGCDNVYLTGYFQDTVDFDPDTGTAMLTSVYGNEIFIGRYDSAGQLGSVFQIGGISNEDCNSMAIDDSSGRLYITGQIQATADFGPGADTFILTPAGGNDVFVGHYDFPVCEPPAPCVPEQPVDISGDTTFCVGDTLLLTASGGTSYVWSTGDTTENITVHPSENTTYVVTVTDGSGCSDSSYIQVYANENCDTCLTMTTSYTMTCANSGQSNGGVKINVSGGYAPYRFSLDGVNYQSGTSFNSLPAGTDTIFILDSLSCAFIDTFLVSCCSPCPPIGIEHLSENREIKIYPNPTDGILNIDYELPRASTVEIEVYSVVGKVVFKLTDEQDKAKDLRYQISFKGLHLPSGVYVVRLKEEAGSITRKIVFN